MFTLTAKKSQHRINESAGEIIAHASVESGEVSELFIGTYEQPMTQPQIKVEVSRGSGEGLMGYLERIDGMGDYTLIYHLDNVTGAPCEVAVREHFS